jgi:pyruvate/2-oxoglutarate dehydrogenase complex dihydrolipoamide acyltransferase (E2) component
MLKKDLQALCAERELPVSGTNDELIARLRGYDAAQASEDSEQEAEPDLPAAAGDEPTEELASDLPDPAPQVTPPEAPAEHDWDDMTLTAREVQFVFPCTGTLATDDHMVNLATVQRLASERGIATRGSARRVGWSYRRGTRHAVYEISRRRD